MGHFWSMFTSWCSRTDGRAPLTQQVEQAAEPMDPQLAGQELVVLVREKYGEPTQNLMLSRWLEASAKADTNRRDHFLLRAETSPQVAGCTAVAETRKEQLVGFVAKLLLYAPTEWYEVVTGEPLPEGVKDDFAAMGVAFDASSRLRRAGVEFYHQRLSKQLFQVAKYDLGNVFYVAQGAQGAECKLVKPHELPEQAQGTVRVVAASDTHLYQSELKIPPGDIFVHAGDLCYEESRSLDAAKFQDFLKSAKKGTLMKDELQDWMTSSKISLSETLQWLGGLPDFKHKVLVGGNHDFILEKLGEKLAKELCEDYKITYLHTSYPPVKLSLGSGRGSVSVWGSGVSTQKGLDATQAAVSGNCAFQYDLGSEEVFRQDTKHVGPEPVDILVTHAPPLGSLLGREGKTFPTAIRELITRLRPRLYVCGHAHNGRDLNQERFEQLVDGVGVNACCLGVWNQRHGFPIVVDIRPRDA